MDQGWLLTNTAGEYRFEAGLCYIEGIRAALAAPLSVTPSPMPCDVWLDISMSRQGSDVVAAVTPVLLAPGSACPDYTEAAPINTRHYCVKVASVAANGTVTDLRPKHQDWTPRGLTALTGGGSSALDGIPWLEAKGCGLAVVDLPSGLHLYRFERNSTAAESSPACIKPDDAGSNPGRWLLVRVEASRDVILDDGASAKARGQLGPTICMPHEKTACGI